VNFIRAWFVGHFSDPQVVGLALLLLTGFAGIMWFGGILAPVIASVIVAYLLEGPVAFMQRKHVPRLPAVVVVFLGFVAFCLAVTFGLLPLLYRQATSLFQQVPGMLGKGQEGLLSLPQRYPEIFSEEQVRNLIDAIGAELTALGQSVVSASLASVVSVLAMLVYLILLPLMVFFFLKDKRRILEWSKSFLPIKRGLAVRVWLDVDAQIGNYVRGKVIEILIVWLVSFITFKLLGLNFAMLLSVLVGVSVVIPYVGRGRGNRAGRVDRILPVGAEQRIRLVARCLSDHPVPGRQSAGAAAVLRGCQSASRGDHRRGAVLRGIVGLLGRVLRDSAGDAGAGRDQGMAERSAARRGDTRGTARRDRALVGRRAGCSRQRMLSPPQAERRRGLVAHWPRDPSRLPVREAAAVSAPGISTVPTSAPVTAPYRL